MMLGMSWTRLGRVAAIAMVLALGQGVGPSSVQAADGKPGAAPTDARVYQFPEPKPDDVVVVNSRGGQRFGVGYWLQAVMASPKDMPTIRAMSDELNRHFVRLVGKHRLEDLLSAEQKRALAAKMVIVANSELAAYDRRAGVAVPTGRVYVEDIVFKTFSMEAVK